MQRLFLRMITALTFVFMALTMYTYDFEYGSVFYNIVPGTKDVTVTTPLEYIVNRNVVIPESVTYKGEAYSVVGIEANAYRNNTYLETIQICPKIGEIPSSTFSGCTKLISVTFEQPSSLTKIGNSAFSGCSSLTSIVIPESVTNIGSSAFYECSALLSVTLNCANATIEYSAFNYCNKINAVYIPTLSVLNSINFKGETSNPLYYGGYLYVNGNLLQDIVIPNDWTELKPYSFSGLRANTVTVTGPVNKIGSGVFSYSVIADEININGVDAVVESGAFGGRNISKLNLNGTYSKLNNAFYGRNCKIGTLNINGRIGTIQNIYSVTIEALNINAPIDSITAVGEASSPSIKKVSVCDLSTWMNINFDSRSNPCYDRSSLYINDVLLEDLIIPDGVTAIKQYTFYCCESIKTVSFPSSIKNIKEGAFLGCDTIEKVAIKDLDGWINVDIEGELFTRGYEELYVNDILINNFDFPESMTNIKPYIFQGCKSLKSVILPSNLETIGDCAFYMCQLSSIELPNTLGSIGCKAFFNNIALQSIYIPSSIKEIKVGAFDGCTSLKEVHTSGIGDWCDIDFKSYSSNPLHIAKDLYAGGQLIHDLVVPEGTQKIGAYAFYNASITSANLPTSVTSIGKDAFYGTSLMNDENKTDGMIYIGNCLVKGKSGSVEIRKGTIAVADEAFVNVGNVTSVIFPETLKTIGKRSFYTANLQSLTLPNSVESIGEESFSYCRYLKDVTLSNGMTKIPEKAFFGCNGLRSIQLPERLDTICRGALLGPDYLSLTFPSTMKFIGSGNFTIISCHRVNVPNLETWLNITFESESAVPFYFGGGELYINGKLLQDLEIPEGITEIKDYQFSYVGLKSVIIPNTVTTIGKYAFNHCGESGCDSDGDPYYELDRIYIPKSVVAIKEGAFNGINPFDCVIIDNEDPARISLGEYAILNKYDAYKKLKLLVPAGSISRYENVEPWNLFGSIEEANIMLSGSESYNMADGYSYICPTDIEGVMVSYYRNFAHTAWQALYLPYELSFEDWAPYGEVAELKGASGTADEPVLHWSYINNGAIHAHTPYIFRPYHEGDVSFISNNINLKAEPEANVPVCYTSNGVTYKLAGTYRLKADMATSESYALSNGDFRPTDSDTKTLNPMRIYLTIESASQKAPIRVCNVLDDNNGTSAIDNLIFETVDSNLYYDMWGRQSDKPSNGIYIHKGRKVIIK